MHNELKSHIKTVLDFFVFNLKFLRYISHHFMTFLGVKKEWK